MKTKMKGLLAIGIIYFIIGCSKDDSPATVIPPDTTIYEGTWRGTFEGGSQGTWIWNVTGTGTVNGTSTLGNGTMYTQSGSVSASGAFYMNISNGGSSEGQFNAEDGTVAGTWKNNDPNNPLNGTYIGTKD